MEFVYQPLIDSKQAEYVAYGDEIAPTTGRKHHQGWIHFTNPRGTTVKCLRKIGEMLGNAHVEPCMGSLHQNDAYVSKEGSLHELGVKPQQGTRADLKKMIERIASGEVSVDDICLEDPAFYHEFGRTLSKAEDILLRKRFRTEMTQGIWYWGPTAVGKSHRAFQGFNPASHYNKPLQDEWWDGYTGQECVILNDFRGQLKFSELLQLVDKWPHSVRRRSREPAPFLAKTVIVTSALPPEEVYANACSHGDSLDQLKRRFQIVHVLEQLCPEGITDTSGPKKPRWPTSGDFDPCDPETP